jgi:hypothetical protein
MLLLVRLIGACPQMDHRSDLKKLKYHKDSFCRQRVLYRCHLRGIVSVLNAQN